MFERKKTIEYRQNLPHTRHMSREIRELDQASGEFGYKAGYLIATVILWILGLAFKLIGKILVSFYRLAKTLIVRLKAKVKKSR